LTDKGRHRWEGNVAEAPLFQRMRAVPLTTTKVSSNDFGKR